MRSIKINEYRKRLKLQGFNFQNHLIMGMEIYEKYQNYQDLVFNRRFILMGMCLHELAINLHKVSLVGLAKILLFSFWHYPLFRLIGFILFALLE